jgi:hypothetical protein
LILNVGLQCIYFLLATILAGCSGKSKGIRIHVTQSPKVLSFLVRHDKSQEIGGVTYDFVFYDLTSQIQVAALQFREPIYTSQWKSRPAEEALFCLLRTTVER